MNIEPVSWKNSKVVLIDQLALPTQYIEREYADPELLAMAIENMTVRGAPAIGICAAFGLALFATQSKSLPLDQFLKRFDQMCERFAKTRPTAVNLFWAIEQMKNVANQTWSNTQDLVDSLERKAVEIKRLDIQSCHLIGQFGSSLLENNCNVLTHCNAGALATGGYGTALGVIRHGYKDGKIKHVYIDETRPFLQGSRLTSWEMVMEKIPATLITDNMAAHLMKQNKIQAVIVGADRIAQNGDVANKIGTYNLGVLCKHHRIELFVAAPLSTIDMKCKSGNDIIIEQRNPMEVKSFNGKLVAPENIDALHPAFDITDHDLISAIITEKGVVKPPFQDQLSKLF